jgi:predicted phage terminase large subunit-like protein
MQRPAPMGGGIFKTEWWQYYRELPKTKRIVQSWDTAFKKGADADYSVCTTWADCADGYYLIDLYKAKVEFPDLKRAAANLYAKYKPHAVLVEDKASGQSLIQELKRETNIPIVAIKVDSDKVSRAYAVTPLIESGRVYLPQQATWLLDYIHSLATFPNAARDDDVDSTTQGLNYLARGGGKTGLLDYYAEEVRKMREAENT